MTAWTGRYVGNRIRPGPGADVGGRARSRCRCENGGPGPGAECGRRGPGPCADMAGAGPVPVQMWQGRARSLCRCGRGGPGPCADPMWQGRARSLCGSDVAGDVRTGAAAGSGIRSHGRCWWRVRSDAQACALACMCGQRLGRAVRCVPTVPENICTSLSCGSSSSWLRYRESPSSGSPARSFIAVLHRPLQVLNPTTVLYRYSTPPPCLAGTQPHTVPYGYLTPPPCLTGTQPHHRPLRVLNLNSTLARPGEPSGHVPSL